mmetsp:Transcript_147291/g.473172  ORF Transcript_147291/g.473172 Transcript_147291/m.473172 type:complete len:365 (-) Transcript_147291:26-1120(-)
MRLAALCQRLVLPEHIHGPDGHNLRPLLRSEWHQEATVPEVHGALKLACPLAVPRKSWPQDLQVCWGLLLPTSGGDVSPNSIGLDSDNLHVRPAPPQHPSELHGRDGHEAEAQVDEHAVRGAEAPHIVMAQEGVQAPQAPRRGLPACRHHLRRPRQGDAPARSASRASNTGDAGELRDGGREALGLCGEAPRGREKLGGGASTAIRQSVDDARLEPRPLVGQLQSSLQARVRGALRCMQMVVQGSQCRNPYQSLDLGDGREVLGVRQRLQQPRELGVQGGQEALLALLAPRGPGLCSRRERCVALARPRPAPARWRRRLCRRCRARAGVSACVSAGAALPTSTAANTRAHHLGNTRPAREWRPN